MDLTKYPDPMLRSFPPTTYLCSLLHACTDLRKSLVALAISSVVFRLHRAVGIRRLFRALGTQAPLFSFG